MFETKRENNSEGRKGLQVILGVEDGTDMERPELRAMLIREDGTRQILTDAKQIFPYVESLVKDRHSKGGKLNWKLGHAIAYGAHQDLLEQRYGIQGAKQFRAAVEYMSTGKAPEVAAPEKQKAPVYRLQRRPTEVTFRGFAPARAC